MLIIIILIIFAILTSLTLGMIFFIKKKQKKQITKFNDIEEDEKTSAKNVVYSKRLPDKEIIKYKSQDLDQQKFNSSVLTPITIQENENKTPKFITCQYCGVDNKIQNTTCEKCGANLKHKKDS